MAFSRLDSSCIAKSCIALVVGYLQVCHHLILPFPVSKFSLCYQKVQIEGNACKHNAALQWSVNRPLQPSASVNFIQTKMAWHIRHCLKQAGKQQTSAPQVKSAKSCCSCPVSEARNLLSVPVPDPMKYVIGSITSQLSSQNVSLKHTAHTPITPASPPHSSMFDLLHTLTSFVATVKAECQLVEIWCITYVHAQSL